MVCHFNVMRTTIRLDDSLLRRAKARAAASGRSLNDFIGDAVRAALAPQRTSALSIELPTFPGGALAPGVDLDDSSALLDLMEGSTGYESVAASGRVARAARVAERPKPSK